LRAARVSRGWSQTQAVEALAALATARGVTVAAPSSLKTQLSRWENQHVIPEAHYRALLREVYGRSDDELGLQLEAASGTQDTADALLADLAVSAGVDDEALTLLWRQLESTASLDHKMGAAAVSESVTAQLTHLERLLGHAVDRRTRRALAGLVAPAATLAARVAADTSRPGSAWRHYEQAGRAAREADSEVLLGCAMVEQARLLCELGQPDRAVGLADWALDIASPSAEPPTRAWLAASRGDVLAGAGRAADARSAYRAAEETLASAPLKRDPLRMDISFPRLLITFDRGALHRHRGHGSRLLRDDQAAIPDLEQALDVDGASARDVASVHVDLAHALRATDHPEAAESHARRARELATRIGSTRLTSILDAGPGSGLLSPGRS
jgi:tetratricopeptide (TPR) repeat protein